MPSPLHKITNPQTAVEQPFARAKCSCSIPAWGPRNLWSIPVGRGEQLGTLLCRSTMGSPHQPPRWDGPRSWMHRDRFYSQVLRLRFPKPPGEPKTAAPGALAPAAEQPAAPETPPGCKDLPAETRRPSGFTMPFVLILVDISFHTLLNEPLQKDEAGICFIREKYNVCFRTKQARDLFF